MPIFKLLIVDSSQLKASEFLRKPEKEGEVEVKLVPGMDMDKAGESSPAMASLLPRIMSAGTKTRRGSRTAHGG